VGRWVLRAHIPARAWYEHHFSGAHHGDPRRRTYARPMGVATAAMMAPQMDLISAPTRKAVVEVRGGSCSESGDGRSGRRARKALDRRGRGSRRGDAARGRRRLAPALTAYNPF
jgi:hypothetical protein